MAVGESLHAFLSQSSLADRLASDVNFRDCYNAIAHTAAKHSLAPLVLREDDCSTGQILDVVRGSKCGYAFLQFPSALLVDRLPKDWSIGDHFGVQLINPKTALASWMDSESSAAATVGEACEVGEQLDSLLASVYQHLQDVWGVSLEHSCFIEALRYQLHGFTSRKLETAYFHSIDLSDRANGPTLVRQQMPRIIDRDDGSTSILAEPRAARLARPGAPACAVSSADDGLAGEHLAGLPGISIPFAILSWPFTSALLHCEDAGLGAYNLLLSGAAKIWYMIPADKGPAFLQYLRETIPNGVGLSYIKQLLPRIPLDKMDALGAVRIVQKPGQAVITCPGLVFHFTLSCGTSEAEATNFYLDTPNTTFADIWQGWCRYARNCTKDLSLLPRPHTRLSRRLKLVGDDRNHVAWTIGEWMEVQGSANSATVMSTSTRALLYHAYNAALSALDEEEYDQLLEHIKLPKVVAFNVECYPVYSETIATIFDGASRSSLLFAILYKGWPLDSKANPTKVAAIFRKQHSATSTCSGAVVPCHIIDECGLIPQLSEEEFVNAPPPRKWGRAEEMAQDAGDSPPEVSHAGGVQTTIARAQNKKDDTAPKGCVGTTERVVDSLEKRDASPAHPQDISSPSTAQHTAKKAKTAIKPDEVSQAEFDAFMASVKKALFKDNVSKAEYTRMKQERDELSSRTAALEKRCKKAEELTAEFIGSVGSLQASLAAKAYALKDA